MILSLLGDALDEARLDRQLGRAEAEGLPGDVLGHAVDLEHDAAGLHAGGPELRGALALAHADFGRLGGHRNVREDADPHAAGPFHGTGDRAAGRLDLPRVHTLRLHGLEAELAEVEVRTALRGTGNPAL